MLCTILSLLMSVQMYSRRSVEKHLNETVNVTKQRYYNTVSGGQYLCLLSLRKRKGINIKTGFWGHCWCWRETSALKFSKFSNCTFKKTEFSLTVRANLFPHFILSLLCFGSSPGTLVYKRLSPDWVQFRPVVLCCNSVSLLSCLSSAQIKPLIAKQ